MPSSRNHIGFDGKIILIWEPYILRGGASRRGQERARGASRRGPERAGGASRRRLGTSGRRARHGKGRAREAASGAVSCRINRRADRPGRGGDGGRGGGG